VTILVARKGVVTPVTPIHEMVEGAGILDAEFARHEVGSAKKAQLCQ
jgi:hypothetical protein